MSVGPLLAIAALVVLVVLVGILASSGGGGHVIRAEFRDVSGLLAHNDVRVNGAKVGTVDAITLTRRGTATVTMTVDRSIPQPRIDAAATIRPVDLLGDIYLDYSPGTSPQLLNGPIPVARTANVGRLADLLRAFTPGARAGAQAMIVELTAGLEERGFDLNRAAIALRPALDAVSSVMGELGSQNAALRAVVEDSDRVVGQLASRRGDVKQVVGDFAAVLRATADRAASLSTGIGQLGPVLADLQSTGGQLSRAAAAGIPLAQQLGDAAPRLAVAMERLGPFVSAARTAVRQTRPTIRQLTGFLAQGRATFASLTDGLANLSAAAPQLDSLATTFAEQAPFDAQALFQKVADQGSEPGNQPLDPTTDPLRHYWRGAAVLSCESFGLRIAPGCLTDLVRSLRPSPPASPQITASHPQTQITPPVVSRQPPGSAGPRVPTAVPPPAAPQPSTSGVVARVLGLLTNPPPHAGGPSPPNPVAGLAHLLGYLLGR